MRQRGSMLIFMIWILLILSVLAMSVGFRSRVNIQLSRFYDGYVKQDYLMHSAVNLASYFLSEDEDPLTDSVADPWYGEPQRLAAFPISKQLQVKIEDEESKLNINKAAPLLLEKFFDILKDNGVRLQTDHADLTASIVTWRGGSSGKGGSTVGFEHKRAPFESIDELRLIQKITPQDVEMLKPYLTVYAKSGDFTLRVNINTVHPWILKALIETLPGGATDKKLLYDRIELYRQGDPNHPEEHPPLIFLATDLTAGNFIQKLALPSSPEMVRMVNQLIRSFTVDSQYFDVRVETKEGAALGAKVEAVLGLRDALLVKTARGRYTLQRRLNDVLNNYPFEILYWSEKPVS
ncbi:MAG: hypothetical protein COV74_05590 [Candidatus Omnitrophica bacterium CG11_big_fil_rev_8_21_14_0_20_45_26]|uniref:Type II secretion system protein K n=1 Tax=Candidatus Abzuiibacterium crystallinum TaxID=1974748 RepID=A0A2H0LNY0_9BACT|nr:MAG: hypothetical protein COV74_05590 [Candidatus Omnitrophica bacterium CG11_big_fil_rev_8_21_14_0_20_45_26]PIW65278.1 MAG: hypothetical protein COW12_02770 [Candidatus Omnitrophica bacterium CG12_big_fil_rev_8_21_14_0_65_45_16]